ncbi:MAG TPA: DNA polymerase III subunit delta' [Gemmataceae bacterium]
MGWDRIRGHELVRRQLEAAWKRGRLGHAYLFAGPEGVGKALFARELARALLCEAKADRLEACDRCPACRQVDAGTHPDFFTAGRPEDKLELPIEVVRELAGHLALRPARGGHKVAILDDADDLNEASANCFLKTLEEPPLGSVLILIGRDPERQLPTIVSRCQVVRFAPLPAAVVDAVLAEQGVADPAQRERFVRLAGGSVGQALALNDPELWAFRGTLLEAVAADRPDLFALGRRWMEFVEEAGKDAAAQRGRASLVLRLLIELLQSALRLALGAEVNIPDPQERARLERLAGRLGPDRLLAWLERCFEADRHIDRRVQLVLAVEALADALGQAEPAARVPR